MADGLPALVRDFQPVTPDTEHFVTAAAAVYHRAHPTPRFFWSPTYLAAQPGVYTWGYIDGCLCVLKRRVIIGNHVMYLVLPPVSRDGDARAERSVIERMRGHHVGTMLSPLDRRRYGYAEGDAKPDPRWPEFAYAAASYADPTGRDHKNTRAALNLGSRLEAVGRLEVSASAHPREGQWSALADTWYAQKKLHRGERRLVKTFARHMTEGSLRRFAVSVRDTATGRPLVHSLTEEVSPGRVVIVSRIRDYDNTVLPDPILLVHAVDCAYWSGVAGPDTLLTSGSAGTPGLTAHKQKLRPVDVMPLGRLDTGGRMTKEEYVAAKPSPTTDQMEIPL